MASPKSDFKASHPWDSDLQPKQRKKQQRTDSTKSMMATTLVLLVMTCCCCQSDSDQLGTEASESSESKIILTGPVNYNLVNNSKIVWYQNMFSTARIIYKIEGRQGISHTHSRESIVFRYLDLWTKLSVVSRADTFVFLEVVNEFLGKAELGFVVRLLVVPSFTWVQELGINTWHSLGNFPSKHGIDIPLYIIDASINNFVYAGTSCLDGHAASNSVWAMRPSRVDQKDLGAVLLELLFQKVSISGRMLCHKRSSEARREVGNRLRDTSLCSCNLCGVS